MASSSKSSSSSSFSVFKEVDESVAKPVLGSDGAARWQDFMVKNSKLLTPLGGERGRDLWCGHVEGKYGSDKYKVPS